MTEPDTRAPVEPVCPRHPDRVSYVRCQRCGRPTCPACQRPAAVGIQCVDCVREQARGQRAVRTTLGGRAGTGRPVVTLTIIGICVVLFVGQFLTQNSPGGVTDQLALTVGDVRTQPWRLLTSAFLHSTSFLPHILLNMYVLWSIGPTLEQVLGRARFAVLYLVCALGGSAGFVLLVAHADRPTSLGASAVGASGAVFGLFGALLAVQRRLGVRDSGIVTVIAINFVFGFVAGGVAWQAHLGGLVTGLVAGALLAYAPRARRDLVQWGGLLVIAVLVLAVTAAKVATLPQLVLG